MAAKPEIFRIIFWDLSIQRNLRESGLSVQPVRHTENETERRQDGKTNF